jgi:hypothetical protein
VVEFMDEVDSDFSVLHRVDDCTALPADVFFRRAAQLPRYDGAVRRRAEFEAAQGEQLPEVEQIPAPPGNAAVAAAAPDGIPVANSQADVEALWAQARRAAWAPKGHTEFRTVSEEQLLGELRADGVISGG